MSPLGIALVAIMVVACMSSVVRRDGTPPSIAARPPGSGWICHKVKGRGLTVFPCYRTEAACQESRTTRDWGPTDVSRRECVALARAECLTYRAPNGQLAAECVGDLEACEDARVAAEHANNIVDVSRCDQWE